MGIIRVVYQGESLLVNKNVADRLNLKPGHQIKTEKEFNEILKEDSNHMILLCEAKQRNQQ